MGQSVLAVHFLPSCILPSPPVSSPLSQTTGWLWHPSVLEPEHTLAANPRATALVPMTQRAPLSHRGTAAAHAVGTLAAVPQPWHPSVLEPARHRSRPRGRYSRSRTPIRPWHPSVGMSSGKPGFPARHSATPVRWTPSVPVGGRALVAPPPPFRFPKSEDPLPRGILSGRPTSHVVTPAGPHRRDAAGPFGFRHA